MVWPFKKKTVAPKDGAATTPEADVAELELDDSLQFDPDEFTKKIDATIAEKDAAVVREAAALKAKEAADKVAADALAEKTAAVNAKAVAEAKVAGLESGKASAELRATAAETEAAGLRATFQKFSALAQKLGIKLKA